MDVFRDATENEIMLAMDRSWQAFKTYKRTSLKERAGLLRAIAAELDQDTEELLAVSMEETHLFKDRLLTEIRRTIFQLTSYADACEKGGWLNVRIDHGDPARTLPKPDIRKTLVPLGPVVVFGASNFPFAYSTAGGDTACALAAGCTVLVKAHPAHPGTSSRVAEAIGRAVKKCGLPENVFGHLYGASTNVGRTLVFHPKTKAIGFTGSFGGGKALFDWAAQREEPIPVFAEMGSVNPVYLFPGKLEKEAGQVAKMYAGSITLSAGQFCTNPGILIGVKGEALDEFKIVLAGEIQKIAPQTMLHPGIAKAFMEKRRSVMEGGDVTVLAESGITAAENQGIPTIATCTARDFCEKKYLHQEIFGPYSLLVECNDMEEMQEVAGVMEGQLTSTLMALDEEISGHPDLVDTIREKCGRIIMNGVPTGVEVCLSMQHGGPYPSTTDSRFTAVGADGIARFARPVAYQNWPDALLPDELKDGNRLNIARVVDNVLHTGS